MSTTLYDQHGITIVRRGKTGGGTVIELMALKDGAPIVLTDDQFLAFARDVWKCAYPPEPLTERQKQKMADQAVRFALGTSLGLLAVDTMFPKGVRRTRPRKRQDAKQGEA